MFRNEASAQVRPLRVEELQCDLAVVGGGLAGTCCAITVARAGRKVVLIQDQPVLGGNASSEAWLWILCATSHMGNNNRWAREGGVIDEILVENMYRNPEGSALVLDTVLLENPSLPPSKRWSPVVMPPKCCASPGVKMGLGEPIRLACWHVWRITTRPGACCTLMNPSLPTV